MSVHIQDPPYWESGSEPIDGTDKVPAWDLINYPYYTFEEAFYAFGLHPTCSYRDFRSQSKKMILKFHPDKLTENDPEGMSTGDKVETGKRLIYLMRRIEVCHYEQNADLDDRGPEGGTLYKRVRISSTNDDEVKEAADGDGAGNESDAAAADGDGAGNESVAAAADGDGAGNESDAATADGDGADENWNGYLSPNESDGEVERDAWVPVRTTTSKGKPAVVDANGYSYRLKREVKVIGGRSLCFICTENQRKGCLATAYTECDYSRFVQLPAPEAHSHFPDAPKIAKMKKLFQAIHTEMIKLKPDWQPKAVRIDFERAVRNAALFTWPNTTVQYCWFHYKRSVLKRGRKLDSRAFVKMLGSQNSNMYNAVLQIGGLPLLPTAQLHRAFDILQTVYRGNDLVLQLLQYFKNTYLQKENGAMPRFHPNEWSLFDRIQHGQQRTTSPVEGANNSWNVRLGRKTPSFKRTVKSVVDVLNESELDIRQTEVGQPLSYTKKKYRQLDEKICKYVSEFNHNCSLEELHHYIRKCAHLVTTDNIPVESDESDGSDEF